MKKFIEKYGACDVSGDFFHCYTHGCNVGASMEDLLELKRSMISTRNNMDVEHDDYIGSSGFDTEICKDITDIFVDQYGESGCPYLSEGFYDSLGRGNFFKPLCEAIGVVECLISIKRDRES